MPLDLLDKSPTFNQSKHNFGVFTPPAASGIKDFRLAVNDQGKVVPFTERDAEGEIPRSNKSPAALPRQPQSMYGKANANAQMTLNPNN